MVKIGAEASFLSGGTMRVIVTGKKSAGKGRRKAEFQPRKDGAKHPEGLSSHVPLVVGHEQIDGQGDL
ncbi:MAG TPA: hypothetical protein VJL29_04745, partial [Thermoguttaceae bacterium]|nr:hypothetical protein [Thermoguttaceae bacterium]